MLRTRAKMCPWEPSGLGWDESVPNRCKGAATRADRIAESSRERCKEHLWSVEFRAALDSDCWSLRDTAPSWEQRVGLQGAQRTCRHSGFADWRNQNRSLSGELCRCQSGFHHFLCCKTLTLIVLRLISTVPTPPENLATWLYNCNVKL